MTFGTWCRRAAGLALWCSAAALAQTDPRSFAVISEIARDVSVVTYADSIGTRLNPEHRQRIPLPGSALDTVVVLASQKALLKAAPGAGLWLLAPADTDFFDGLQTAAPGDTVRVPADLAAALKERKSTHLLLYTRHRSVPQFRFVSSIEGKWPLDGLGYYIERRTMVENLDTKKSGLGFLAPYAHFRATLVDVATAKVLKTETVRSNHLYVGGDAKDGSNHPWEALTSAEKMTTLRDMLTDEVSRLVPILVATP